MLRKIKPTDKLSGTVKEWRAKYNTGVVYIRGLRIAVKLPNAQGRNMDGTIIGFNGSDIKWIKQKRGDTEVTIPTIVNPPIRMGSPLPD